MTRRSRREELLEELDRQIEDLPPAGPTRLEASYSDETSALAYCPILHEMTGKTMCSLVDCGDCRYLDEVFPPEEVCWMCSACSVGQDVQLFWADGECAGCGKQSSVLQLVD